MKTFKYFLALWVLVIGFSSCQSVRVATDYDKEVDFNQYQSFAFFKPGIDKAEISDLDKRRILRAIDAALLEKGMTKSKDADLLVSIFTEATEEMTVYPRYYGWYNPWYSYSPYYYSNVSSRTEGTLYIDLIDAKTNTLVWQGVGIGTIEPTSDVDRKTERINKIVKEILDRYPPQPKRRK